MSRSTILIVEDESLVAQDIKLSLENLGYRVPAVVSSGEEAIQKAKELSPDMVLMDIVLKGEVDGIEAAKFIYSDFDIPVIFLTSHSDNAIVERAKSANPYGYLLKPFKERELVITLEMSLQRYWLEQKLKKKGKELRESEEKFRTIFEASPIGIELYTPNGKLLNANKACLEIFGVSDVEEISGFRLFKDMNVPDSIRERLQKGEVVHYDTLFDFDKVKENNHYNTSKSGSRYLDVVITPISDKNQGTIDSYLVQVQDITERKQDEILLRELSLVDDLTKLYNRRGFLKLTHQQITTAERLNKRMLLVFVDLDNLKSINDTFSHEEGDTALISAANILNETFRSSDLIARWGGDEFTILMVNSESINEKFIEERLQQNIDEYNATGEHKFNLSLSWGIAEYDMEKFVSIEELIAQADRLMYKHKKRSR